MRRHRPKLWWIWGQLLLSGDTLAAARYAIGAELSKIDDDAKALPWMELAAEQGLPQAQHHLGVMYAYGRGVTQDDAEAVRWYWLAAEQGYAPAQTSLGYMHQHGRGVTQDDAEAVRWYWLAAEQGHANGQNNLGPWPPQAGACSEMSWQRLPGLAWPPCRGTPPQRPICCGWSTR